LRSLQALYIPQPEPHIAPRIGHRAYLHGPFAAAPYLAAQSSFLKCINAASTRERT
jgi:hypothetical protein